MNPYFLMAILYMVLAALAALDVSLVNFQLVPAFSGFVWLRVHFITLGILSEFIFGALPIITAARAGLPKPRFRWDIWLLLNVGIILLLLGIPAINAILINIGGTAIFLATSLLIWHLKQLAPKPHENQEAHFSGRWFYVTGLVYFLLGILIGTGLWQPWLAWFQMTVPIEVHIHANNWGFMSLVFAGLLVDFYPQYSKMPLGSAQAIRNVFWMISLGALALVLGPWFKQEAFSVIGIILHLSATAWLLYAIIKPIRAKQVPLSVGIIHILSSYVWIIAPVLVAPLIILKVQGFPGAGIEANAPQALVYGWVLQFAYGLFPLILRRWLNQDGEALLGGSWLSLIAVHSGGVLLWLGIFNPEIRLMLHGIAYGLWFVSLLPILLQITQSFQFAFDKEEKALS